VIQFGLHHDRRGLGLGQRYAILGARLIGIGSDFAHRLNVRLDPPKFGARAAADVF